jgi:peptidoglycan-associated lipoprotein
VTKRICSLICAVLFAVVGCKTTPDEAAPEEPTTSRTEFPAEPSGLDDRGATSGGSEASSPDALRTVYFGFDEYSLSDSARADLRHNAGVLQSASGIRIEIQGNCDERGTNEYNLALGNRRAEQAKKYLADLGIDRSRISTISFGEENPAVRGSTEAAWAKNRRDDFIVR